MGLDAATVTWCRRPRYWWTIWYIQCLDGEAEATKRGVRHLHPWLKLGPVNELLEDGYTSAFQVGRNDQKFHTFTRCRPFKQEPPKPTGKATASAEALKRWAEDQWRYSPYQYADHLLVWKADAWRCLNSNERIRMLGFPDGYLNIPDSAPLDT